MQQPKGAVIMKKIFITISLCIALSAGLYAQTKPAKISLAVLDLKANNCPASLARATADLLVSKLYPHKQFTLIERSQMNQLLKEKNIKMQECADADCEAKIGKVLSVEKLIAGSISKFDDYKISLRIIDVKSGKVDISILVKFNKLEEIETSVSNAVDRVVAFFNKEQEPQKATAGFMSVGIGGGYAHVLGDLSQGTHYGWGGSLAFRYDAFPVRNMPLGIQAGFFSLKPARDSIESMTLFPVQLIVPYKLELTKTIALYPAVGFGYMLSMVSYDQVHDRDMTDYEYISKWYYDPMCSIQIEFDVQLTEWLQLAVIPAYKLFFEKDRRGQLLTVTAGLRFMF